MRRTWVAGIAFVSLWAAGAADAAQYVLTDLGALSPSGQSRANALNENGQVVGSSTDAVGWSRPVIWSNGTIREIPTFNSALPGHGQATAINDLGQVVGYNQDQTKFEDHAFSWSGSGAMQDLGLLPGGRGSRATGVNNDGLVVGYGMQTGAGIGFTWTSGALQPVTGTGGVQMIPFAVNDDGVMAGRGGGASDSFVGVPGATQTLGSLPGGGPNSTPYALNNLGQVAGVSQADGGEFAFLWTAGVMQNLGALAGHFGSTAYGINDHGDVVGQSEGGFAPTAVLWSGGALYDLNSFVVGSGWTLVQATDINNKGQIVGYGANADRQIRAFLLTPVPPPVSEVPEPAVWLMLVLGFGGLGGALRARRRDQPALMRA